MRTTGSALDGTPAPPIDCASEPSCKVPPGMGAPVSAAAVAATVFIGVRYL